MPFSSEIVRADRSGQAASRAASQNSSRILRTVGRRWVVPAIAALVATLASAPVPAAERAIVNGGLFELSADLADLEAFARGEMPEGDFGALLQTLNPQARADLQAVLSEPLWEQLGLEGTPNVAAIAHVLNEPMMGMVLVDLGEIVRAAGEENGGETLKAAILAASALKADATLTDALREFPGEAIEIDALTLASSAIRLADQVRQSRRVVDFIAALSARQAANGPAIDLDALPDLRDPGPYPVETRNLTVTDPRRDRSLPLYVYWPQRPEGSAPLPVVAVSHGLGSGQFELDAFARHLASYGFFVVLPEHPGSNGDRQAAFFAGRAPSLFEPEEFLDRPADISFALDEVGRRTHRWGVRLNLDRVAVMGHSFGGYTAIALAGGRINFDSLERVCGLGDRQANLSLYLQCRALALPRQDYDLRDPRVAVVGTANAVSGSIFGEAGLADIDAPVLFLAGAQDFVTPLPWEQLQPFLRWPSPDKYLALAQGRGHVLDGGDVALAQQLFFPSWEPLVDQDERTFRGYSRTLAVALVQRHLQGDRAADAYLQPAYGAAFSQPPAEVFLVRSFPASELGDLLRALDRQPEEASRPRRRFANDAGELLAAVD